MHLVDFMCVLMTIFYLPTVVIPKNKGDFAEISQKVIINFAMKCMW
jgi:hypothetical protein